MTRLPPRRLLVLALAAAASATALPAFAQAGTPFAPPAAEPAQAMPASPFAVAPAPAPAAGSFIVSDIRVDGLQRVPAGTVFTYLPIERGDRVDGTRVAEAIRALYKTGFFEDVRADRQGDILVMTV